MESARTAGCVASMSRGATGAGCLHGTHTQLPAPPPGLAPAPRKKGEDAVPGSARRERKRPLESKPIGKSARGPSPAARPHHFTPSRVIHSLHPSANSLRVLVRPRDGRRVDRARRGARDRRVHAWACGRSMPDRRGLGQGQVRAGAAGAQGLGVGDWAGEHRDGDARGRGRMKGMKSEQCFSPLSALSAFSTPAPSAPLSPALSLSSPPSNQTRSPWIFTSCWPTAWPRNVAAAAGAAATAGR